MIGKYMIDVSDLASWQKRQITWVCVATCWTQSLDQGKNVTELLVLTRIRQDVATGKCVAGMISPPRQHTSCSSKVISASTSIAHLLHRVRIPWILEHPCDSWLWDEPKIRTLAAQPRMAWALWIWVSLAHHAECALCSWLGTWTIEIHTVWLASVLEQVDVAEFQDKRMFILTLQHDAQISALHITTPALPVCLSRLPWFSTCKNEVSREPIFCVECEIIHSTRQRILLWELLALLLLVDQNQCLMVCVLQLLAQIVPVAYLTQKPVARTNLLVYAVLERHDRLSVKNKWMTTPCTLIIFVIQHWRLLASRHRVTSQHGSGLTWTRSRTCQYRATPSAPSSFWSSSQMDKPMPRS